MIRSSRSATLYNKKKEKNPGLDQPCQPVLNDGEYSVINGPLLEKFTIIADKLKVIVFDNYFTFDAMDEDDEEGLQIWRFCIGGR